MRLFIAEKPELAKAICAGLGGNFIKKNGYFHHPTGSDVVTWCFGHMLKLKDPDELDNKYKLWRMETLPIEPILPAQRAIPADKQKQVAIIQALLKKAHAIINAGDPDEEGQLLIDELLRFLDNSKPVMRLLINDNTPAVVKKALANLRPNSEFEHLGWKAESRAIADQLFGYNLTRGYSLTEQAKTGKHSTLHIGRVQTPILGLVVRRDREHASHCKSFYYVLSGDFVVNGIAFVAKYQPKDSDPIDDKGRLIDPAFAHKLANALSHQSVTITDAQTKAYAQPAPLPYNLIKLQGDASRLYGISAKNTDKITQALREQHHLITYNRSDCQYLSDEQFADVGAVLAGIARTLPNAQAVCQYADQSQKGRAFNSNKVSAHHAIIPTQSAVSWNKLSIDEQNIYKLVARSYLAQFYPPYEYDESSIILEVMADGIAHQFIAHARFNKKIGWKKLYKNDPNNDEITTDDHTQLTDLRKLQTGMAGQSEIITSKEQQTQPKALYTEATLLKDLTQVAKYVKDPTLTKILKEKDQDKQGEHGGIGTPATRSAILDKLFANRYLHRQGKAIISTAKAQELYDKLDDVVRFPDMTALWHEQQKAIKNQSDVNAFINELQTAFIAPLIAKLKADYTPPIAKPMPKLSTFNCQKCGKKLIHRTGTSKAGKPYSFFGCSGFPKCKQSYDEIDGTPKYD